MAEAIGIYRLFAENLRQECKRYPSIAEVCRGTGINRQQFNKYLAGQILPNKQTLRKLCSFFKIDEVQLFDRRALAESAARPVPAVLRSGFTAFLGRSDEAARAARNALPMGFYRTYFPLHGSREGLVCGFMRLTADGDSVRFTRHTFFSASNSPRSFVAGGKHNGVVLATMDSVYFIATNQMQPHNISFLAVERKPLAGSRTFVGLANMQSVTRAYGCLMCLEYLGNSISALKRAWPLSGMLELSDPRVNTLVRHVLRPREDAISSQLSVASVDDAFLEFLPGSRLKS